MPSSPKFPKRTTSLSHRPAVDGPTPTKPRRAAVARAGNSGDHAAPEADALDEPRLLQTLMAVKAGDFSVRLPVDRTGMEGKIYDALNEIISLNQRQARELERLSDVVGRQGKLRQRATLPSVSGEWAASMDVAKKKDTIDKHIDLEVDPDARPAEKADPRPTGAKPRK